MPAAGATPFSPPGQAPVWTLAGLCGNEAGMRDPDDKSQAPKGRKPVAEMTREERLKAALKANMARRKAQARARKPASGDEAAARNTSDE